jgi:hypothetical protein
MIAMDVPDLHRDKRRRLLWMLFGLALAIAVGIAGWLGLRWQRRASALREAGAAWSAFQRCMIGAPARFPEEVDDRIEMIHLGNFPPDKTAPWPKRCIVHATALIDAFEDASEAGANVDDAADRARGARDDLRGDLRYSWPLRLAVLWEAIGALELPSVPSDGRLPPAPAHPIDTSLARAFGDVDVERDGAHVLVWNDREVCSIAIDSGPARCTAMPPRRGLEHFILLRTGDVPAYLSWSTDRQTRVLPLAGGEPIVTRGYIADGAFGTGDAFVALASEANGQPSLIRWSPNKLEQTKLDLVAGARFIKGGYLLWYEGTPRHLFARRLSLSGPIAGPAIDAGESDEGHAVDVCNAGDTTFVATRYDSELWSVHGDEWHRVSDAPAHRADAQMTCAEDRVTLTWLADRGVRRVDCTPEKCEPEQYGDIDAYDLSAVALGDKVLVFTDPPGNERHGDVWMRLAPLGELENAHQHLLVRDSFASRVESDGQHALVVMRSSSVTRVVRIDASGRAEAVR